MVAVTHDQAAAVLVALGGEGGDVGVHLGLQRIPQAREPAWNAVFCWNVTRRDAA
ncbi:hypothetical protein [Nonomuraea sp. NPDC049709]|uniref:hypothetical protein n=1 Tax=Nonomuraea sp. NPDC049709 TaxID=3154736 RepID=UPI003417659A